ncbi:MAG TPA: hypothetical protein VMF69_13490 [Gemmataceae bacterium]|nr:hypothetical protein [Gemmataceae bacterium]
MKRFILSPLAVALVWLSWAAGPVAAQNTYPFQAPRYGPGWQTPLSPYLNMLIPGNAAVNYFALVEPQFQRRQNFNQINQTLQGLVNQIPQGPGIMEEEELNAPMRSTGHPTAVNYTGSYFSTLTGQPYSSVGAFAQRRTGAGMMGSGRSGMMGGSMGGGMRPWMGGTGGSGMWPNMRPGMGMGR